jgi:hypothetical protein
MLSYVTLAFCSAARFSFISAIGLLVRANYNDVKNGIVAMQEKGLIQRVNGKRNGKWEIMVNTQK